MFNFGSHWGNEAEKKSASKLKSITKESNLMEIDTKLFFLNIYNRISKKIPQNRSQLRRLPFF